MPYTRKSRPAPKKKSSKRAPITTIVKRAMAQQSETKAHIRAVTEFSYSTLTSPSGFFRLNELLQGDRKSNRNGNMIMPTRVDIRGQVQATNQEAVYYKVLLLEKNSARDVVSDLCENDSGNFAPASSDLTAMYARINTGKYKVLASRMLKTGTVSNTANDSNAVQFFNINVPLRGKMYYDEGSNNCNKRDLVLVVFGRRANNDETTGLPFEFTFNSKMYFKDV